MPEELTKILKTSTVEMNPDGEQKTVNHLEEDKTNQDVVEVVISNSSLEVTN